MVDRCNSSVTELSDKTVIRQQIRPVYRSQEALLRNLYPDLQ